jgi:hypothetical protein
MSTASFMKRLEALERLIKVREPRLLYVNASPCNEQAAIDELEPPVTDEDTVVVVMNYTGPDEPSDTD